MTSYNFSGQKTTIVAYWHTETETYFCSKIVFWIALPV